MTLLLIALRSNLFYNESGEIDRISNKQMIIFIAAETHVYTSVLNTGYELFIIYRITLRILHRFKLLA